MSVENAYKIGYGFFVTVEDLEAAGILEPGADCYGEEIEYFDELVMEIIEDLPNSDLLSVEDASESMHEEEPDRAFVIIARSSISGNPRDVLYRGDSPAIIENFDSIATPEEQTALDLAAEKCGIEFMIPQTYFYLSEH